MKDIKLDSFTVIVVIAVWLIARFLVGAPLP